MNSVSLLYHDVIKGADYDSSGFRGGDANIYKLDVEEFRKHIAAIAAAKPRTLITVDDGGVSAYESIAGILEGFGMDGIFFVSTDFVGQPGFLSPPQIRELRKRGHLIGSHSCSHPPRISHCSWTTMLDEWRRSIFVLSDILGEHVQIASVPGGYYSRDVARTAAMAGIRTLFTSEPTLKARMVDGSVIVGRFCIKRGVSARTAAALAKGAVLAHLKQAAYWNTKKVLKRAGGESWLRFRRWMLTGS